MKSQGIKRREVLNMTNRKAELEFISDPGRVQLCCAVPFERDYLDYLNSRMEQTKWISVLSAKDTSPINAGNFEVIQKLHHPLSAGVTGICVSHLDTCTHMRRNVSGSALKGKLSTVSNVFYETYRLQQLDLIQSGLCIMFSTFYNLHSHKTLFSALKKAKHKIVSLKHSTVYSQCGKIIFPRFQIYRVDFCSVGMKLFAV